jgi:GT2 family glycosyltransferase
MIEANASAARPVHIEIVTPVFNRRETTRQCLHSLARVDQTNLKVHVIIVDDGSSDGTAEMLRADFPDVEIVPADGSLYYTRATNLAVEAAMAKSPDYVLAINNDSIFHDQFLQQLVKCAKTHPRSVVGPVLLLWDRPHQVAQVGARWQTWYGGWRIPLNYAVWDLPDEAFDVDIIVGNCVMVPADAIREVGLMHGDPFRFGFGDLEWTPRMKRAGWRLLIERRSLVWFEPNTLLPSPSKMGLKELFRALLRNRMHPHNLRNQLVWRWYSAPSRPAAVAGFLIYQIRLLLRWTRIDQTWPYWPDEKIPTARPPIQGRN